MKKVKMYLKSIVVFMAQYKCLEVTFHGLLQAKNSRSTRSFYCEINSWQFN